MLLTQSLLVQRSAGDSCFTAQVSDGSKNFAIHSSSVIVATGATEKWLGIPYEEELYGRNLHTCAYCDARFYVDARNSTGYFNTDLWCSTSGCSHLCRVDDARVSFR